MENKEYYTKIALNNAKCRGRSKWMYEDGETQRFVTAYRDGRVEYTEVRVIA